MRRWDRFLDTYIEEYRARGLAEGTVAHTVAVLEHWGQWLKRRRPRPVLERIDAPLLVRYLKSRASFRSKATVYGTLSVMRGMGDYLVREGVWTINPLRWMQGPKVRPYNYLRKLPRQGNTLNLDSQTAARAGGASTAATLAAPLRRSRLNVGT